MERNVEYEGNHDGRLPAVVVRDVPADRGPEAVDEGSGACRYGAKMRPAAN